MECGSISCASCNSKFKERPFELNIYRVRGLNKPYTRTSRIFGNILHMIDSMIGIITLGHVGSNIGGEWITRELEKFFQYREDEDGNDNGNGHGKFKFKLKRFKFKIWWVGKIRTPFTRSEKVFGHVLHMIDSMIGIITFGNFDSFISHQHTSRQLYKLELFINKYGIDKLRMR